MERSTTRSPAAALRAAGSRLRRFGRDRAGNVAVIAAICIIPLAALAGFAIDYNRLDHAKRQSQDISDASTLFGAASREENQGRLRRMVEDHFRSHLDTDVSVGRNAIDVRFTGERRIDMTVRGEITPIFGRLIGMNTMGFTVNSVAERAVSETLEIALVLDNTDSMRVTDGGSTTKIAALRTAAEALVRSVTADAPDNVRIALVPYANYVNVGTSHRGASWLAAPPDRTTQRTITTQASDRVCTTHTTRTTCVRNTPNRTCTGTRVVDGATETYTYDCTGQTCTTQNVTPYQTCTGPTAASSRVETTYYRWLGCVLSRTPNTTRLHDGSPTVQYAGLEQSRANSWPTAPDCLTPLSPLNSNHSTTIQAIRNLTTAQMTYIPSGVIWGVNVLSPTAPFTEGAAYTPENRQPRKIMVLMTDGDNTLRFLPTPSGNTPAGAHVQANASQAVQTNNDTRAICTYAKSRGIELYTVALAVPSQSARDLIRDCATDSAHYFEARDNAGLIDAFSAIAASIDTVRLVH